MKTKKKTLAGELRDRRYEFVFYLEPCGHADRCPVVKSASEVSDNLTLLDNQPLGTLNVSGKKTRKREIVFIGLRVESQWHKDLVNIETTEVEALLSKVARLIEWDKAILFIVSPREEKIIRQLTPRLLGGLKVKIMVL